MKNDLEKKYQKAIRIMMNATTQMELERAKELFIELGDYKNSAVYEPYCVAINTRNMVLPIIEASSEKPPFNFKKLIAPIIVSLILVSVIIATGSSGITGPKCYVCNQKGADHQYAGHNVCASCYNELTRPSSYGGSSSTSSKGPWHSSNVKPDSTGQGPYYCYGKNNTCNNKTYNYQDLYCDSCDPNGDNREG